MDFQDFDCLLGPSVKQMSNSEAMIRKLFAISSDYGQGFVRQVRRTLQLGCEHFGLEIGVLTQVTGDHVDLLHVHSPPDSPLKISRVQPLDQTLCSLVVEAGGPVGLINISQGEFRNHPGHRAFGSEVYLGTPVFVEGELFGTICFHSTHPRLEPFSQLDYDTMRLIASWVAVEIHRQRNEAALREATEELLHLTRVDPLTQMLNRRGMQGALDRISQRVRRGDPPFAALLVDLDEFKRINDTYGHAVGDKVLQESARRIRNAIRPTDIVGRIGGDEFLLALPGSRVSQALPLAERVRQALAGKPIPAKGQDVFITASIGVAEVGGESPTIADIISAAGPPLAASKRSGKNRVTQQSGWSRGLPP